MLSTETSESKIVDLNEIHLISNSPEEKKHAKSNLSDNVLPEQTQQTSINGITSPQDENKMQDDFLNVDHLQKSYSDSENALEMCRDNADAEKPCVNGENVKKSRKNGVHACQSIPNGDIKDTVTTETTKNEKKQ